MYIRFGLNFIILALIILSVTLNFSTLLIPDLGWHLYVAQKMLDGKKLYHDFFEVNLPFIFYFTLIPAYLAKILSVDPINILKIYNTVFAIGSLFYCCRLINSQYAGLPGKILQLTIAYVIFIVPLMFFELEFGQKEHIFIIFYLPYFLTIFLNNYDKDKIPIAILAGLSFCVKPFFIIFFIASELLKIFLYRKFDRDIILVIILINVLYYLSVYLFHYEYFEDILPLALNGYAYIFPYQTWGEFASYFWYVTYSFYGMYIVLALISVWFVKQTKDRIALLIIILTSLLLVFIQKKCFWYHYLPVIACSAITVGFSIASLFERANLIAIKSYFMSLLSIMVLIVVFCFFVLPYYYLDNIIQQKKIQYFAHHELREIIKEYDVYKILVICNDISSSFPLVNYAGIELTTKQHSQQLLDGLVNAPSDMSEQINNSKAFVVNDVVQALRKRPEMVIIRQAEQYDMRDGSLSHLFRSGVGYLQFFSNWPVFRAEWRNYQYKTKITTPHLTYNIYVLKK